MILLFISYSQVRDEGNEATAFLTVHTVHIIFPKSNACKRQNQNRTAS